MGNEVVDMRTAMADFQDARARADLERLVARLTGKSASLLSYEEVRQKLKARESAVRELEDIPLNAVVGSVGRYTDFTRSFLPTRSHDASRWARVQLAVADMAGVPPIEVYQVGQVYFVLDGNHRVSVARQSGASHIQAYVTQVQSRVPLSPDVQPDELIIKAEYAGFLEYTHLDELRPGAQIIVSVPGQYTKLEDHIEVHRFFAEMEQERDIPYPEAVGLWYDEVYLPVARLIQERDILRDFPGRTETDLYLWIAEHRVAMERELGWKIRPESALTNLVAYLSPKPGRRAARWSWKVRELIVPDQLLTGPPPGQWRKEHLSARRDPRRPRDESCHSLFADILVAINGEESGWQALEQAIALAQREDAWLHGLHVLPAPGDKESQAAQALQAEFERRCRAAGVTGRLAVEAGEVVHHLFERSWMMDMVIASLNHPPSSQPLASLRSGFQSLVQRCPRPVLSVPKLSPLDRPLLAYDGSPKAEEALFVAAYLAGQWGVPLVVVSVTENGHDVAKALERARDYLETHAPLRKGVQAVFVEERGPAAAAIAKTAAEHEIDLLIMGGYSSSPLLQVVLGSTVNQVLRQSALPVLICR
ncbi:MAG: universal stress protein [Thermoflexales bacterium]|nr:universal stress protein [Thermoflexales bacterium]